MGEQKVVNRNIAYALGLICIVLATATVGIAVYSGNTDNIGASNGHTDAEYSALAAQLAIANQNISSLTTQIAQLQNELANNTQTIDPYNNQTRELYARIDALTSQLIATNGTVKTLQDYYNSLIYVYSTESHDLAVNLTTANNQIASLQNQIDAFNAIGNLTVSTVWVNNQTVTQAAGNFTVWSESASYAGYVTIQVSSSTSSTYANVTYSSHGVNYNTQTNVGTNGIAYFPVLPSSNIKVTVGNTLTSGTATENVTVTYYY
jgi:hypothetical protein